MFSRKLLTGLALFGSVAVADRYLTEMEELIMQVKKDTDGKEHIAWKESLTSKMMHSSDFTK